MKCETYCLGDVCTFIDYRGKTPPKTTSGIPLVTAKIVKNGMIQEPQEFIAENYYDEWMRRGIPKKGSVVFTTEAPLGEVARIRTDDKLAFAQRIIVLEPKTKQLSADYLFYALQDRVLKSRIEARSTGTTVIGIKAAELRKVEIDLPSLEEQEKIAAILCSLDDKIELNNKINENLFEQVLSLYHRMFVETVNDQRLVCRADEYFDISIGKTPPRKEPEWFSHEPTDRVWVSIADMGNCGVYIGDSSEYLTHKAVERFNVKLVPSNTVILSFKLTVGRVAITDGIMTTNEAIAHFKTETPEINEYLYCYLKGFNYQTMGSTSSIATAVNSKIIKEMPFVVPTDEELAEFHNVAGVAFEEIKQLQRESIKLTTLREVLLPKLMSGEINISSINI